MKEFRSINIDAGELVRNLGRLGELRSQARPIESIHLGLPLSTNEVRAVWEDRRDLTADLPSILISSEIVLGNILPRILALPSAVAPVTSLMKTWLIEDFKNYDFFAEGALNNTAALGFVGLTIGELITTIGPDADLRLMGMDGVRRTLSFVCATAVRVGWRNESLMMLAERWSEASALTANEVSNPATLKIAYISRFLSTVSDLGGLETSRTESLAHQIQYWIEKQNDPNQRDLLKRSLLQVASTLTGLKSREKRYDLIMEVLSSSDEMRNPLEQGFLISLIEPGSFEFLELAKRADRNGSVAAAYCACAAILGKESALRKFNGFGWTILNHGLRGDAETPLDISIAELRVLHDGRRSSPIKFRTRSPWLIDVELLPMVTGSFGNLAKRKASSQRSQEVSDATAREEFLSENLMTAMRALEDAYRVIQGKRLLQDKKSSKPRTPRG